jgi:hypothetical protein
MKFSPNQKAQKVGEEKGHQELHDRPPPDPDRRAEESEDRVAGLVDGQINVVQDEEPAFLGRGVDEEKRRRAHPDDQGRF